MYSKIKAMVEEARVYFPANQFLQRQWIRKTHMLMCTVKHALLTGGWRV